MFSVLPLGKTGLPRTFSAEIRQTKREPRPKWGFVSYRRTPGIEAGPGDVGAKGTDPVLFGCDVNLPKVGGKRHQGLLTKVLGIQIPFINGSGGSGHCSGSEPLVDHLLDDGHGLGLQKDI
jgi:hypothetical protein